MLTLLPGLLRPSQEGTLCLHRLERVPGAFVSDASPVSRALLVFCVNQGISASLFYFLIVDSGPPGSSPLKDPNISYFRFHMDVIIMVFVFLIYFTYYDNL